MAGLGVGPMLLMLYVWVLGDASGPSSPRAPGSGSFTIPKLFYRDYFQVNIHYPARKVFIHTFPA